MSSEFDTTEDNTLHFFSRDICEDGTLSVIFVVIFFVCLIGLRNALHYYTVKQDGRIKTRQLTTNHWLEKIIVTPFVPSTLENFVAAIFFLWFVFTITMGVTRYYEKQWANDVLAQQTPFNLLAYAFGCKGLDPKVIPYPLQVPDVPTPGRKGPLRFFRWRKKNAVDPDSLEYSKDIDFFFGTHLTFGILWLSFGALQIYLARYGWSSNTEVRHRSQRVFGYFVVIPHFFIHIYMATRMASRNPVGQIFVIQAQYFAMIAESTLLLISGIYYRRKGNVEMHMVRMFYAWCQSVIGSGAIRVTAWVLWLIGQFYPLQQRIIFERGACQAMAIDGFPAGWVSKDAIPPAQMGTATHCWKAVFMNLNFADLLILWLEWVFMCLTIYVDNDSRKVYEFDRGDKAATVSKFKQLSLFIVAYIFMLIFNFPAWFIQGLILVYAVIIKIHTFRMIIAGMVHDDELAPMAVPPVDESVLDKAKRYGKIALLELYMLEPYEEHPHQD